MDEGRRKAALAAPILKGLIDVLEFKSLDETIRWLQVYRNECVVHLEEFSDASPSLVSSESDSEGEQLRREQSLLSVEMAANRPLRKGLGRSVSHIQIKSAMKRPLIRRASHPAPNQSPSTAAVVRVSPNTTSLPLELDPHCLSLRRLPSGPPCPPPPPPPFPPLNRKRSLVRFKESFKNYEVAPSPPSHYSSPPVSPTCVSTPEKTPEDGQLSPPSVPKLDFTNDRRESLPPLHMSTANMPMMSNMAAMPPSVPHSMSRRRTLPNICKNDIPFHHSPRTEKTSRKSSLSLFGSERKSSIGKSSKKSIYASAALRARLSIIPDDEGDKETQPMRDESHETHQRGSVMTDFESWELDTETVKYKTSEQESVDQIVKRFEHFDRFWAPLIFLYSLYQLIMIPSRIGLDAPASLATVVIDLVVDLMFWAEIGLRFTRPYEDRGLLVTNPTSIARRYFRTYFWWDLMIALPLEIIGLGIYSHSGSTTSPWRHEEVIVSPLWRVNKLLLMRYSDVMFSSCFKMLYAAHPLVIRAVRTMWAFTLITHYFACVFLALHFYEGEEVGFKFSAVREVYTGDISTQYFLAYDYSVKSMVGMGRPGKTMPQTDLEAVYCLLTAFAGVAVYATVLATIANLISDNASDSEKWRIKSNQVSDVLGYISKATSMPLPRGFVTEIRGYLHHDFWVSRNLLGRIDEVMEDLPNKIGLQIERTVGGETMSRVPMFKEASRNDPAFLHYMLSMLESVTFCKDEIVMSKGDEGDSMYFIMAGEMGIYNDKLGEITYVCHRGSALGEIALLHDCRRTATVKALTYCSAYRLKKASFIEAEAMFPKAIAAVRSEAADKLQKIRLEEIVKKVPLFAACADDPDFIREVVGSLEPKSHPPQSEVVTKGEVGTEMFFVAQGELGVKIEGETVFTLKEGNFFGEIVMLFDTRRTASIVAETHVDLFTLSKTQFRRVMEQFPEQSKQIEQIGRERFRSFLIEDLLKKINLFAGLKGHVTFLDKFASLLTSRSVEDDECIVQYGEMVGSMFFVSTGDIAIINENDQVAAHLTEGDHFGGMSLIRSYVSLSTLLARSPCELYVLTREDFLELSREFEDETQVLKEFAVSQLKAMVFDRMYSVTTLGILRAYYGRLLSFARMARYTALHMMHSQAQTRESIKGLLSSTAQDQTGSRHTESPATKLFHPLSPRSDISIHMG